MVRSFNRQKRRLLVGTLIVMFFFILAHDVREDMSLIMAWDLQIRKQTQVDDNRCLSRMSVACQGPMLPLFTLTPWRQAPGAWARGGAASHGVSRAAAAAAPHSPVMAEKPWWVDVVL